MTKTNTPDTRLYVHGNGRVLLFHPGRTAISTYYGKVSWVENCKTPEAAAEFVAWQNEILAKEQAKHANSSAQVQARAAAWTYRLATEADAQIGK